MNGQEALARLRHTIDEGGVIMGAGAGTGLSAKCAEAGGADLIIIYNSGRYRMAGRGSLAGCMPYGDANAIVMEMAGEVLPVVRETPVLAGVCGTDPFRLMPVFLEEIKRIGFSGRPELPDRRPLRRPVPAEPRRDRHGLRPRGRHDPGGPRGWACSPRRTSSTRDAGAGDGRGRGRRRRRPHGPHDEGRRSGPRRP